MLKFISKPQSKNKSIVNKINNKPHKLDYEAIENIVNDTNIRTSQMHMSNKHQQKSKLRVLN